MKKTTRLIVALILSTVLLSALTLHISGIANDEQLNTLSSAADTNSYIIGDVNFDGYVDSLDAALILKYDADLPCNDRVGKVESFIGVTNAYVDEDLHLWIELFDGTKVDTGYVGISSLSAEIPPIDLSKNNTEILIGDVNTDGYVDSLDAALILKYDAALPTNELVATKIPAASVKDSHVDNDYHYWLTLTDGTKINAGYVRVAMYTVTFKDFDGTVLKTETVDIGESVEAPNAPSRSGYRFIGWDGKAENVTGDMTITAQYVQQFTVTFVDYDGTVLKYETVDSGKSATAPSIPTRPYYTFTGWDTAFTNVLSDLTVTAQYSEKTYAINYYNTKGVVISEEYTSYTEHKGLHLPTLSGVEGYAFKGWYTLAEGGDRIDDISVGSTKFYNLYAHWEATEYTITYNKSAVHSNPKTYTIEDEIVLEDPTWSGLAFVEWTDHSGKVEFYTNSAEENCAKIPKGTTGNIELTAKWETYRNRVIPSDNKLIAPVYDELTGKYYFLYDLGTIENVVLALNGDSEQKTGNEGITLTITKSQEIQEGVAKELGTTIANSVTQTQDWSDVTTWAESLSASEHLDIAVGLEGGIKDLFKASLQVNFGMSISEASEWSKTHGTGGGYEIGGVKTEQLTSTVSYTSSMTTSSEVTRSVSGDMPNGYYSYVYACNVRVFAVVSYNAVTGDYGIDTYSVLDNMHNTLLYYPTVDDYNNASPNSLAFDLNEESKTNIKNIIANSYFIKYDGNGGVYNDNGDKTDKYIYLYECGVEKAVANCNFTKTGCVFAGWKRTTSEGFAFYTQGQMIKDLAAKGELITLCAEWTPLTYTVSFNVNGGMGSCSDMIVTFDSTYGTLPTITRLGYTFSGWTLNGQIITAESKVSTTENHTLIAQWTANTITVSFDSNGGSTHSPITVIYGNKYGTLPTPTKKGYTFDTWKYFLDIVTSDTIVDIYFNHTLYANWTANKYTVIYDANGGAGTMETCTYNYDSSRLLTKNSFTRDNYTFLGWSTDPAATSPTYTDGQSVKNLASSGSVTLYAVWLKTASEWSSGSRNIQITKDGYEESIYLGLNYSALKEHGYTNIKVTIVEVNGYSQSLFSDDKPFIEIYNRSGNKLMSDYWDPFPYGWEQRKNITYTISIDALRNDGSILFRYDTDGGMWNLGTVVVKAEVIL